MLEVLLLLMLAGEPGAREFPAPGGEYVLRLTCEEVRMSHQVELPTVIRSADGSPVWSLDFPWSVSAHRWLSSDELEVTLRRYPGAKPPVRIKLLLSARQFLAWDEAVQSWERSTRPWEEMRSFLDSR